MVEPATHVRRLLLSARGSGVAEPRGKSPLAAQRVMGMQIPCHLRHGQQRGRKSGSAAGNVQPKGHQTRGALARKVAPSAVFLDCESRQAHLLRFRLRTWLRHEDTNLRRACGAISAESTIVHSRGEEDSVGKTCVSYLQTADISVLASPALSMRHFARVRLYPLS